MLLGLKDILYYLYYVEHNRKWPQRDCRVYNVEIVCYEKMFWYEDK